jgi:hypothetical protein
VVLSTEGRVEQMWTLQLQRCKNFILNRIHFILVTAEA